MPEMPPGPKDHGYLVKNDDGSWTAVAVVQERVSGNGDVTYTVTPAEMPAFARTMVGGELRVEHQTGCSPVGVIADAWASSLVASAGGAVADSGEAQRLMAALKFIPNNPVAQVVLDRVKDGSMSDVSLGVNVSVRALPDGGYERTVEFKELSIVLTGDMYGSRLLAVTDPATGQELPGLGMLPQQTSLVASAGPAAPASWLRETPIDAKSLLSGRIRLSLFASAKDTHPIITMTSAPPSSIPPKEDKVPPVEDADMARRLTEAIQKQQAAEALIKKMQDAETVRAFWEKHGTNLKALAESASAEDDDEAMTGLRDALQKNDVVLDPSVAGSLTGLAQGYAYASKNLKRAAPEPAETLAASAKQSRFSDGERDLRARAEKAAAAAAVGQDYKGAWNNRVAGAGVVDPNTGAVAPMKTGSQQPAASLDLIDLLRMAVAPSSFTVEGVQSLTASIRASPEQVLNAAATRDAVAYYSGGQKPFNISPDSSIWANDAVAAQAEHAFRLVASAGLFM